MKIEAEKNHSCLASVSRVISFSKFSKRTNLELIFLICTFASQLSLLEMISYGEYTGSQLFYFRRLFSEINSFICSSFHAIIFFLVS